MTDIQLFFFIFPALVFYLVKQIWQDNKVEPIDSASTFSFKHPFPFCDSGAPLAWTFQFGNTLLMNRSLHYSAPYSPAKCPSLHGETILQQRRYMSPRQEQLPLSVSFPWEQAAERWVWWANLMLHYANWSSQLTIAPVTGWADWPAEGECI